ncbi:PREDICTED: uncharacterized protein LOC104769152 [Camelina sativa]|uniref:Uncharacterized protein LOC104769152 n=1 Tax=Camelina sativa TaxID=90675 RepID=A0ABM0XVH1_CAMSA|nr:PREDICTED: uncharacterized protein LOC104769152 [Camelina sativa]
MSDVPVKLSSSTVVIWDLEECPIPEGLDASDVCRNVNESLHQGEGYVLIRAYFDFFKFIGEIGSSTVQVIHVPSEAKEERRKKILVELLAFVAKFYYTPVNIMLVVGDISEHHQFRRALIFLKNQNFHNVFLALPHLPSSEEVLDTVSGFWLWKNLSLGGPPRFFSPIPNVGLARHIDLSCKNADSKKTCVFWDVVDCPMPEGYGGVRDVSQNIRQSLKKSGYNGEVSIRAYVNQTNDDFNEYASTDPGFKILLAPQGDRDARLEMLLVDLMIWAIENRPPANFMLILGDIFVGDHHDYREFVRAFVTLKRYTSLLAQPQKSVVMKYAVTKWLWKSLSTGGDHLDDAALSETSQGIDNNNCMVNAGGDHLDDAAQSESSQGIDNNTCTINAGGDHLDAAAQSQSSQGIDNNTSTVSAGGDHLDATAQSECSQGINNNNCTVTVGGDHLDAAAQSQSSQDIDNNTCTVSVAGDHLDAAQSQSSQGSYPISPSVNKNTVKAATRSSYMPHFIDTKTKKTCVFWDVVDCPMPEGHSVTQNIRQSLKKSGYNGEVSIRAYMNQTNDDFNEYVSTDPGFEIILAEGDRVARLEMLLVDLLIWAIKNRPPANYMLILGDIFVGDDDDYREFVKAFVRLEYRHFTCLLVQPQKSLVMRDYAVKKWWLWKYLSTGVDHLDAADAAQSESSQGVDNTCSASSS